MNLASIGNGKNGHEQDRLYVVRGECDPSSEVRQDNNTMCNDQRDCTIGLVLFHGDTIGDVDMNGTAGAGLWISDFNMESVGAGFGIAQLSDDSFWITPTYDDDMLSDATAWNAFAYLTNPGWEVAVGYQSLDNAVDQEPDVTVFCLGANWYRGNAGKWQAQWTPSSDGAFEDGDVFTVGFSVGLSR